MNREQYRDLNGSDYIREMLKHTQNGKLTISDEDGQENTYPMRWDQVMVEFLIYDYELLLERLDKIGEQEHFIQDDATAYDLLGQELYDVWWIYIRPFPAHRLDQEALQELWMKQDMGDPLTEEEKALHREYRQWFEEHARSRLPVMACSPASFISRAKRYTKLVSLGAPEVVRQSEARFLAEEMALYMCGQPRPLFGDDGEAGESEITILLPFLMAAEDPDFPAWYDLCKGRTPEEPYRLTGEAMNDLHRRSHQKINELFDGAPPYETVLRINQEVSALWKSPYAHGLLVADDTVKALRKKGIPVVVGGKWKQSYYAWLMDLFPEEPTETAVMPRNGVPIQMDVAPEHRQICLEQLCCCGAYRGFGVKLESNNRFRLISLNISADDPAAAQAPVLIIP